MAKEFIGNAANVYLLPFVQGEGDAAVQKFAPMSELIMLTIEQGYALDATRGLVKSSVVDTSRLHISLPNLSKYIESLIGLREQMESMARAIVHADTVESAQGILPGV